MCWGAGEVHGLREGVQVPPEGHATLPLVPCLSLTRQAFAAFSQKLNSQKPKPFGAKTESVRFPLRAGELGGGACVLTWRPRRLLQEPGRPLGHRALPLSLPVQPRPCARLRPPPSVVGGMLPGGGLELFTLLVPPLPSSAHISFRITLLGQRSYRSIFQTFALPV